MLKLLGMHLERCEGRTNDVRMNHELTIMFADDAVYH